jgi:hypothetical protein
MPNVTYGRAVTLVGETINTVVGNSSRATYGGLHDLSVAALVLDVTAAATLAGDTFDVFIDTAFNFSAATPVWINAVHFTQVLGNGGAKRELAVLTPWSVTSATTSNVLADLAGGAVRLGLLGDGLRVRATTVGTGSFTYAVYAHFLH